MSKNNPPNQTLAAANTNENNADTGGRRDLVSTYSSTRRHTRPDYRYTNVMGTTCKAFEGDIPKIVGVLGLRSENVTKK